MFNTNRLFVRNSIFVFVKIVLFSGIFGIGAAMLLGFVGRQERRFNRSLFEFGSVDSCHDDSEELNADDAAPHNNKQPTLQRKQ